MKITKKIYKFLCTECATALNYTVLGKPATKRMCECCHKRTAQIVIKNEG